MSIYNSQFIKEIANSTNAYKREEYFSKSKDTNKTFDIFLSHSYLDREVVLGLYIELSNMGYSVYVDWIVDPQLNRNSITKESAELIRNRMKSSRSLLYAISTNAQMSKWMPWELGFVDGKTGRCAIVPVANEITPSDNFNRSEYLILYPFISKSVNDKGLNTIWVNEKYDEYVNLSSWITGTNPYKR